MDDVKRTDLPAPDIEDVITGAVQGRLELDWGPGYIATDWFVCARVLDPDGRWSSALLTSRDLDEVIARGLHAAASNHLDDEFRNDEDDDGDD